MATGQSVRPRARTWRPPCRRSAMFPPPAARALRSARSGLIGAVSGAISDTDENPLLAGLPEIHILRGIHDVLDARGLTILLTDTGGRADAAPRLLRALDQHRVDGTIYAAPNHRQVALPPPTSVAAPLVVANGFADESTPSVTPDDYTGHRELVEGLIDRGHRRIAYLQLPHALLATRHRTRAYEDAHRAAGIPLDPKLVVEADRGDCDAEARTAMLQRAIEAVLASTALPTAICCGNDRMALAVYGMLRARGLRIPEDISVAGLRRLPSDFQDALPPAHHGRPALPRDRPTSCPAADRTEYGARPGLRAGPAPLARERRNDHLICFATKRGFTDGKKDTSAHHRARPRLGRDGAGPDRIRDVIVRRRQRGRKPDHQPDRLGLQRKPGGLDGHARELSAKLLQRQRRRGCFGGQPALNPRRGRPGDAEPGVVGLHPAA